MLQVRKEESIQNLECLSVRILLTYSCYFFAIGEGTDAGDYRKGSRMLGKGMPEATPDEQTDEYGRVTKGPYTLRNGATYTG